MSKLVSNPSKRVTSIPDYPLAVLGKKITGMKAKGIDVIRLDMGSPDLPPAPHIIEALVKSAQQKNTHGYGGYFGTPAMQKAIATYYKNRFGVTLEDNELLPLIGSKEGLANMHLAWLDPGDISIIPDPCYITHAMGPLLANGSTVSFPLDPQNNWYPDFSALSDDVLKKARLMWLNYPNNPSGAIADLAFFEDVIAFCRKHDILFCHDNAYADITYDGYKAVSPLQIDGAKEVVIEFNSMSKTYNLAGWRVGMAVGHAGAVKALATIKTQMDSGIAKPVQAMAIAALTGDQTWLVERNAVYQERRDLVVNTLRDIGINVESPKGAIYIWFKVPNGGDDVEFHEKALSEGHVSISPGSFYGEQGRGWMRVSLVLPVEQIKEAMARLKKLGL
ncbi:MAG: hypothetical protein B6242_05930 [Anaerolineaceae bacterium 4572_78]|nr:MAG: hypothetical protein B6242_05930 [Anaerolineaceae bacterium 4572_78]